MLSKCCTQYVSKSRRHGSSHRTGKVQSSSRFPRRAVQTIRQLHSSPMLARSCLKSCMTVFNIMWTKKFQMSKLGLEKAEEPEIKLPTLSGSWRKQRNSRKISISVSSTMWKPLSTWSINCGKLLKIWEYQTTLPVSWETCMWVKKQHLKLCMEHLIGSGSRKEHDRAVCCFPVYLTYMLSTSWEIPGWMSYKLESRQVGETSTISDMQMIPLYWQKAKRN